MAVQRFVALLVRSALADGEQSWNAPRAYLCKKNAFGDVLTDAVTFDDPEKAIAAGNAALGALINSVDVFVRAIPVRRGWILVVVPS